MKILFTVACLLLIFACDTPKTLVGTYRDTDENIIYGTLNLHRDGNYTLEYISGCLLPDVHSSGKWYHYKKQIILKSIDSIPAQHLEISNDTLTFDNWKFVKVSSIQRHTDSLKSMELECLLTNIVHKDYCTRFSNDSTLTFSLNRQECFIVMNAIEHSTQANFLKQDPYFKIYIYNNDNRVDTLCIENSRNYLLNSKPMTFPDTIVPAYVIKISVSKHNELLDLLNRHTLNSFNVYGAYFPFWISGFENLRELSISGAAPLDSILPGLAHFKNLETVNFYRQDMDSSKIAQSFENLKQAPVTSITLGVDKTVTQIPENICLLNKLNYIGLWGCENLNKLPACLNNLPALQIHIICSKNAEGRLRDLQQAYKQLNIELDTLSD